MKPYVIIVEDHHDGLPWWGQNIRTGSTLLHIDEHMDYKRGHQESCNTIRNNRNIIDQYRGDAHYLIDGIYNVDDFLGYATDLNIFTNIYWVKPNLALPSFSRFTHYFAQIDYITNDELLSVKNDINQASISLCECEFHAMLPSQTKINQLYDTIDCISLDMDFFDKATDAEETIIKHILRNNPDKTPILISRSVKGGYILDTKCSEKLTDVLEILSNRAVEYIGNRTSGSKALNLGWRCLRHEQFSDAAKEFSKAADLSEGARHYLTGYAYWRNRQTDQALSCLKKASDFPLMSRRALTLLGVILSASELPSEHKKGIGILEDIINELKPNYRVIVTLAVEYIKQHNPSALNYILWAHKLRPQSYETKNLRKLLMNR